MKEDTINGLRIPLNDSVDQQFLRKMADKIYKDFYETDSYVK